MKIRWLLTVILFCAAPVWAQTGAKLINELPFPLVTPARAQQLAEREIILHLRDVTLLAALQTLQKQSGIRFDSGELVAREIFARHLSLDLKTTSFSRAFNAILKAAKTQGRLQHQHESSAWNLEFRHFAPDISWPRSGVGPFQIELQRVNSTLYKTATPGTKTGLTATRTQCNAMTPRSFCKPRPRPV